MDIENVWMIMPSVANELFAMAATPMGPRERMVRRAAAAGAVDFSPPMQIVDGIATIQIDGVLTRRPEMEQIWYDGVSTEILGSMIESLGGNPAVGAIVLRVDSPGGEASGLVELADTVRNIAAKKPVVVVVDRLAASGAYFLASAATAIYAAAGDARVGSIGTLLVLYDQSERFAMAGIKPVVVATGAYKGLGALGAPITTEQLAYLQERVDEVQKGFEQAVKRGRNLPIAQVREAADGRTFTSAKAIEMGLIDGVKTYDQVVAQLRREDAAARSSQSGERQMAAATITELGLLPGVTDSFIVEAQKAGWTVDQAQSTWMERQHAANVEAQRQLSEKATAEKAAADKANADAQAAAAAKLAATAGGAGVDPNQVAEGGAGAKSEPGAGAAFKQRIDELVKSGVAPKEALRTAVDENPDGHKAYVEDYNAKHDNTDAARKKLVGRVGAA